MKTREELNAIKEEVEALNHKLAELTEDELSQVVGGVEIPTEQGSSVYDATKLLLDTIKELKEKAGKN